MGAYHNYSDIHKNSTEIANKLKEMMLFLDINSECLIPKIAMEEESYLKGLFTNFLNNIKGHNLISNQGIILLANPEAKVLTIDSSLHLPNFLEKDQTEYFDFNFEKIGINAIGLTAKYMEPFSISKESHFLNILHEYSSLAIPLFDEKNNPLGIIGFLTKEHSDDFKEKIFTFLEELSIGLKLALPEYKRALSLEENAERREALLTISQKLYTIIDVNEVLLEAVKYINLFYPNGSLEILMTQDYYIPNAPIKRLSFIPSKEDISGKAFLEGKIIINRRKDLDDMGELAVPLKGKQGIYGVIHLVCSSKYINSEEKLNFISNIANIISNAFENAKLYQQSNNLVNELKIVNKITKRLNESLNKDFILQFVVDESVKLFDANYVCVLEVDNTKESLIVIASNVEDNIGNVIHKDYGYLGLISRDKEPIIIADIENEQDFEDNFVKSFGCRSLIAVPIIVNDDYIGLLTVSSFKPHHFSYENFRIIQLFSQHLGLTLTNAILHEKIQQLAIKDYLTDLYNRSHLDNEIEKSLKQDALGSILLFDIDDFKKINDSYGHQVGDKVLVQIANIFKSSIREGDTPARWGGEELVLYLPKVNKEIAFKIAERVTKRIKMETNPQVTVSCGISSWEEQDKEINSLILIRQADQALYEAKEQGKDQIRIYSGETNKSINHLKF